MCCVWCQSERREGRELPANSATEQLLHSLDTGDLLVFNRTVWDGRVSRLPQLAASSQPLSASNHPSVLLGLSDCAVSSAVLCCSLCSPLHRCPLRPSPSSQPVRSVYVLLSKYLNGEYDACGVVVRDRSCGVSYVLEVGCTGVVALRPCDTRLLHSNSNEIVLRKLDCARTEQQLDAVDQLVHHLAQQQRTAGDTAGNGQPLAAFACPIQPSVLAPLERMMRLAVACVLRGAGGGDASRSLHQLGQYVQTQQERQRTVERLAALHNGLACDTMDADGRLRLAGKQQRLIGALQRLERRESELRRQLKRSGALFARTTASGAADFSEVAASPCPSAALVAVVLHCLGALPVECWPSGGDCPVPPPLVSQYQPKHFLSSTTLPLAAEAVLERELFVKSAGKPLPYNVT